MDFNKVFEFDKKKFQLKDSEYRKLIEKSLRKLSKVLINDSFLGYEYSLPHIESFVNLLDHHKDDYDKFYKSNYDRLENIKKEFYCNEKGFTTELEVEIFDMINNAEDILKVNDYKENNKSQMIFAKINLKLKEFILETNLIDKTTRFNYQKKIASINELLENNSLVSLLAIISEFKELGKIKKENGINYQNMYLRNVNRFEYLRDNYKKTKSYFALKESEIIELQFNDIKDLLDSENYKKFDNASDILGQLEEKFKDAISEKKDRIIRYLTTEVDGLKGHVWEEDLEVIRNGAESIISDAKETNDFNNLNLDKLKKDEKIFSKKNTIDQFIKYLINSSSNTKKDRKAKLANFIKQSETFYSREISIEEFENFTKDVKSKLKSSSTGTKSKYLGYIKWVVLGIVFIASFFVILNNISSTKKYNSKKGEKYLRYVVTMAKLTRKTGAGLDKSKIRKRISVPAEDLRILNMTDSTVTIDYKGHALRSEF